MPGKSREVFGFFFSKFFQLLPVFCPPFLPTSILRSAICGVGKLFKRAFQTCIVIYINYISFLQKKWWYRENRWKFRKKSKILQLLPVFCPPFLPTSILRSAIYSVGKLFKRAFQTCIVIYINYISFLQKKWWNSANQQKNFNHFQCFVCHQFGVIYAEWVRHFNPTTSELKRGEIFDPEHILYSIYPRKTHLGKMLVQLVGSTRCYTCLYTCLQFGVIYAEWVRRFN